MSEKVKKVDVGSEEFEQQHDKQAKGVYVGVIILLILLFIGGFTYGIFAVTAIEGQMDMSEASASDFTPPATKQEAIDYIQTALDKAVAEKPKLKSDHGFQIDDSSIQTDFGSDIADLYNFVKSGINDLVKQDFDFKETKFFDDISKILKTPDVNESDVDSFNVNYITYKCRMCGNESGEMLPNCELCGCDYSYRETYKDDIEISLNIKNTPQTLNNNFSPRSVQQVQDLLKGNYENLMKINNIELSFDNLAIKAIINRNDGKIKYLEYSSNPEVKTNITFINDFEALATSKFDFKALEITAYSFEWPAINLSSNFLQVGFKDNSTNIIPRLVCDDPVNYTVNWKSSDPSICDVDKDGYLKSHKKVGKATITASFEFGGKIYSSDCEVDVMEGVTDVKLNKRSKTLAVGETFQLEAKIKPSDATIQTVKWYTFDEKIAKIDENGLVTAVSPGTVKVFVITDNGSHRSSCEVTVK